MITTVTSTRPSGSFAGRLAVALLAALAILRWPAAASATDLEPFRRDLDALAAHPSRVIGSEGYYRAASYIEQQLASLPNVEWKKHEYEVTVPLTRWATLRLDGASSAEEHAVYPFWPAQIRVNSTPADGITGKLVYLDLTEGFDNVRPAEVAGHIAIVESTVGEHWNKAAYFGARAILVLGDADTNHVHLRSHDIAIPVNIPRFYVPPGALAERIRAGGLTGNATLKASVEWTPVRAFNYYALVRGSSSATEAAPALMFSAPFESSSLVPDLSPGASQAVQAAAALALLRDFAAKPTPRSVIVFFGGADSIQFLATRQMFMALSDVPAVWREKLAELAIRQRSALVDYEKAQRILPDPTLLDRTRHRSLIDRIVRLIETDAALEQDLLFRARTLPEQQRDPSQALEIQRLEQRQAMLSRLRFSLQEDPRQLSNELLPEATHYVQLALRQLAGDAGSPGMPGEGGREGSSSATQTPHSHPLAARREKESVGLIQQYAAREKALKGRIQLYEWLADALKLNRNPGTRENESRLIELLVALDLSDRGVRCGPLYYGTWLRSSNISDIQNYRDWFDRQQRALTEGATGSQWFASVRRWIDLEPLTGVRAAPSWLCSPLPVGSELARVFATPGMSMITLDDLRLRRDTPTDVLANLDVWAIEPQLQAINELFRRAWSDPAFRSREVSRWQRESFVGQVVSESPGRPVPDLPRSEFLVTYMPAENRKVPPTPRLIPQPWTLGLRKTEVATCDAEGHYRFEGLPRVRLDLQTFFVAAYRLAHDGSVTACTDVGRQTDAVNPRVTITTPPLPVRSLVFHCREFSLTGLYDPRFLQVLVEAQLLDARRNAEPQRYNLMVRDGMAAGFIEPDAPLQLIVRYGRVGNRLLLVNMDPQVMDGNDGNADGGAGGDQAVNAARGFHVDQLNDLGPAALVTAQDFWRLDELRLNQYRRADVSSSVIDGLHRSAGEQIEGAEAALRGNDGSALMNEATGAWANEARVYAAAQEMAQDVIRAAIFLLLLCVPFSFCMERLIVGTSSIYKQIAGGAFIFAIMALALWSFHPAFKISASPLIIILAFAIILMSVVVMGVIYGKFDSELKRIRSGRGSAETASFARASVLMSAVLLGIANMRKRKFRTALTSITIVLITFAVLCFTSATRYVETTMLPAGIESQYPGVMLRQRGFRPMPAALLDNLAPLLRDRQVVQRWWNVNAADAREQIHVVAAGATSPGIAGQGANAPAVRVFAAQAVLGLSPGETRLSPAISNVLGPANYQRLENGETQIIFLSRTIAEQLRVAGGDVVRMGGIDLEVAGIFDADAFDDSVRTLSGDSLAPLRYAAGLLDAGGRALAMESESESLDLDARQSQTELSGTYEHLSATQFVVVPAAISRMLPNATLRSVAVRIDDPAELKSVSDELARRFALALFAGFEDGVRLVSSGSALPRVSGAKQVAVPLAIAGLIIFNTMMGSIAERRREIHVYTSLGLAPLHVGALFVAEAMTYGLIGTVFGYVIGQGVGTAMLKLGWLGNVTLNYSGTSAMLTMGLILIIVLLSALVPARLASKIAAPSIERTWKVPLPKDGEIQAQLPFTINRTAAEGALAYLAEFFNAHQEGSIGKFSAGRVEFIDFEDTNHRSSRGLRTTIWLTPFDLGVRQDLTLLIHPGQFADIYEVQVILRRLSGDDGSWYRMNRTFLTELRKQFLQWRSLSPQRMLQYVEESRQLFHREDAEAAENERMEEFATDKER